MGIVSGLFGLTLGVLLVVLHRPLGRWYHRIFRALLGDDRLPGPRSIAIQVLLVGLFAVVAAIVDLAGRVPAGEQDSAGASEPGPALVVAAIVFGAAGLAAGTLLVLNRSKIALWAGRRFEKAGMQMNAAASRVFFAVVGAGAIVVGLVAFAVVATIA
ncbi:hypothetical protein [Agromyces archimandritae]|uniref:Uncharacterized protein n=1 Tax=Agromyces archimandritae TaxID=2781962 RepID=A0A975IPN9_9MICO|nr:hypothetical protein [Agromyces archimandritae]QTX05795.1 hypothetical protein G127AT_06215 [Agromyces archimandritae]